MVWLRIKNLEKMSDVVTVLNAKQGLTVGDNLTGLSNPYKASTIATDAVFVAKTLSYGGIDKDRNSDLGGGNPLLMSANTVVANGHLNTFLKNGSTSGDAGSLKTTSAFGSTTDAIIRILGSAYFEAGKYDFKIAADDGYTLYILMVNLLSLSTIKHLC